MGGVKSDSQTLKNETEEDAALLRQYQLSEERMRRHRLLTPWRGEYRYFEAPNVV
jgi:hypothetical protein